MTVPPKNNQLYLTFFKLQANFIRYIETAVLIYH